MIRHYIDYFTLFLGGIRKAANSAKPEALVVGTEFDDPILVAGMIDALIDVASDAVLEVVVAVVDVAHAGFDADVVVEDDVKAADAVGLTSP